LLCVAAFATKQSFIGASLASVGSIALNDWRRGFAFGAWLALGFGAFFAYAASTFGSGFWFCVFRAPQNPMQWSQFTGLWSMMLVQPVAVLLLAAGICGLAVGLVRRRFALFSEMPYPLFVLSSAAVAMITLPKAGAWTNYFFEWLFASCLLLAHGLCAPAVAAGGIVAAAWISLPLAGGVVSEVALAHPPEYAFTDDSASERATLAMRDLAREIEALTGTHPKILNFFYAGISYPLPGLICISDPFLYALLWNTAKLDPEPMLAALRAREYDGVFVPPDGLNDPNFLASPAFLRALVDNYRLARHFPGFDYLVRKSP